MVVAGLAAGGAAPLVGDASSAKAVSGAVLAQADCKFRVPGQAFRRQDVLTVAGQPVDKKPRTLKSGQWIDVEEAGRGTLCLSEGSTKCDIKRNTRVRFRPPRFPKALFYLARGRIECGSRRPPDRYFQTRTQLIKLDDIERGPSSAHGFAEGVLARTAAPRGGYLFSIEARRGPTTFRVRRGRTAVATLGRLDGAVIVGRDEKVTVAAGRDPSRPVPLTAAEKRAFRELEKSLPAERDPAPPAVELSGPSGPSSFARATLSFGSPDKSAVFSCSLDGQPFVICASPARLTALARGSCHTFTVRATDAAGRTTTRTLKWLVDDSRIAFTSFRHENPELYTIPPESDFDAVRVTRDTDPFSLFSDEDPSWSPDLRRLAFERPPSAGSPNLEIYVIAADGSGAGLTNLTNHRAVDQNPAWSPDGTRIAFESSREENLRDIYVMNSDGTNVRRLTDHPADDFDAAWSPDSRSIAFASTREDGNIDVYAMSDAGESSGLTRLTTHDGQDFGPDWSPDGRRIAFHSRRAPTGEGAGAYYNIWVSSTGGVETGLERLTTTEANDYYPSWSPDGSHLVFYSERPESGREPDLYLVDVATREQTPLTAGDRTSYLPDWSGPGTAFRNC